MPEGSIYEPSVRTEWMEIQVLPPAVQKENVLLGQNNPAKARIFPKKRDSLGCLLKTSISGRRLTPMT